MAVTCEWKYLLGKAKCKMEREDGTKENIYFYGGGNSLFVATYKNKNLYTFAIDEKHAKKFLNEEELNCEKICIYINKDKYINKEAKRLAKLFVELEIPFNIKRR